VSKVIIDMLRTITHKRQQSKLSGIVVW